MPSARSVPLLRQTHVPPGRTVATRDEPDLAWPLGGEAAPCGCASAAVAGSAGFLGYVGYLLVAEGAPSHWGSPDLLWGSLIVLGTAVAGKAFGLMRGRRAVTRRRR